MPKAKPGPASPAPWRVLTWNVNSIRLRGEGVKDVVGRYGPDVICLQETKVTDDLFPHELFDSLGYTHRVIRGQPGYNGVAIASRIPFSADHRRVFCSKDDCRHIGVTLPGGVELHNFYIPAGGDIPDRTVNDKFGHKLDFVAEMTDWFAERRQRDNRIDIVGDFNIAPLENDVWSHKQLLKIVSHTPIELEAIEKMRAAHDFVDGVRHFVPADQKLYSWWSYRNRDWKASDRGRRLDHVWVTPALQDRLMAAEIYKPARDHSPPSDHVPVVVTLAPVVE
ncbi:MAG: exodeoxyribonuclease III [Ferrovibrionaceae bacterium]